MNKTIAVLGAGSWGTALAIQAAKTGGEVLIWARSSEVVENINSKHINPTHLSDLILPFNIKSSSDITAALDYKHILIAIPAQSVRKTISLLKKDKNLSFIIASKGIENNSLKLMSEVILEEIPGSNISVLSGPNFAHEVAKGYPSVTSIASKNHHILEELIGIFNGKNFKVDPTDDTIGVEICGAMKNVIAIACGICLGSNLGENARAAVLTMGFAEMGKLVIALGGKFETLITPAGIGDLNLTCSSKTSRNMLYGMNIATGKEHEGSLSEGSYTAKSIDELALRHGLVLPLVSAVAKAVETPKNATNFILEALNKTI